MTDLRSLPSVDKLLRQKMAIEMAAVFGRLLTTEAIRDVLAHLRERILHGGGDPVPGASSILQQARYTLESWTAPTLRPVINASGVIIHTNLGRAPLSRSALQAMNAVAEGYSTLEYSLKKGGRGSRLVHAEELLRRLTGAESALVVNNNAAAVFLALTALARRRRVVIARSQLVEIGGGFRVPDVMAQSGAKLVEVGTTNRVHLRDYEQAIAGQPIRLVMRAHRSNFAIIGFTTEPELASIAAVAHAGGIPLVDDLGSGSLLDTTKFGLSHEPMVQESLEAGADLVCFSGDKLIGGPQAGIIIGKKELVDKLKHHPLARALRADKLCLAALSATLLHYLKGEAEREIPVWRMIAASPESICSRAQGWVAALQQGEVIPGESTVGGGSLPGETLPTFLVALRPGSANRFLARLRGASPPVIARTQENRVLLDPRTVSPEREPDLLPILQRALQGT